MLTLNHLVMCTQTWHHYLPTVNVADTNDDEIVDDGDAAIEHMLR